MFLAVEVVAWYLIIMLILLTHMEATLEQLGNCVFHLIFQSCLGDKNCRMWIPNVLIVFCRYFLILDINQPKKFQDLNYLRFPCLIMAVQFLFSQFLLMDDVGTVSTVLEPMTSWYCISIQHRQSKVYIVHKFVVKIMKGEILNHKYVESTSSMNIIATCT